MTYIYTEAEKARNKRRVESGYFRDYWAKKQRAKRSHGRLIGKIGESIAQTILTSGEFVDGSGYDFKWCNSLVEVKVSSFLPDKHGWAFHVSQLQLETADFLMLIALDQHNKYAMHWFMPIRAARRYLRIHGGNLENYQKYLVDVRQ